LVCDGGGEREMRGRGPGRWETLQLMEGEVTCGGGVAMNDDERRE